MYFYLIECLFRYFHGDPSLCFCMYCIYLYVWVYVIYVCLCCILSVCIVYMSVCIIYVCLYCIYVVYIYIYIYKYKYLCLSALCSYAFFVHKYFRENSIIKHVLLFLTFSCTLYSVHCTLYSLTTPCSRRVSTHRTREQ